ncbi:MAG TPA: hypothetical protein VM864_05320 [Pyrinomonadaceae bacterium]|jgi:hypothetical protein|nr:hypothetical protein [Pyrinomonadaceae bacterium]
MRRILLIATLIFISCAVAPARSSREAARAETSGSSHAGTGVNLRPGKDTAPRPAAGAPADVNRDWR